jgi:hypothetical protein
MHGPSISSSRAARRASERGSALACALLTTVMLFGVAASYMTLSYGGFENSNREMETVRARLYAEEGLHRALAEVKAGDDDDGDGLGDLSLEGTDGRTAVVTMTDLGGGLFRMRSVARLRRANAASELVVELIPAASISFAPRAAITAKGLVGTLGNITVDGRDWNYDGTAVVGPGKYGISSMDNITNGGNSKVGGNGMPPFKPPLPGANEKYASWNNATDEDGDGPSGEENFDGDDDDGDGEIDEDTNDYPTSPDIELKLPEGTLKAMAQAQGTYFATQAALSTYLAANGGEMPGGKIIYCDFTSWLPAELGGSLNAEPSILVHHTASGNALMKNVHGAFKGLVLADGVEHLNGDFLLLGALMSFAPESYGNAYGNGNAFVRLCTAALNDLPSGTGSATVRIRSWSRAPAN